MRGSAFLTGDEPEGPIAGMKVGRRGKEGIAVAVGIVKWFSSQIGVRFHLQGERPRCLRAP
jgi:hypothetical protein